jgi:SNF2 family DNA or RNA helicase
MIFNPHDYQGGAACFLLGNRFSAVFADPGLGKTTITLMVQNVLKQVKPNRSTLIIAPKSVVLTTWPEEIQKWQNFKHLTFKVLHGKDKEKRLQEKADIYLINPEGIPWLFGGVLKKYYKFFPFYWLVVDESTKFKTPHQPRAKPPKGVRFKFLKDHLPLFRRRTILTGTPTPNSIMDIYNQIYILDLGKTLGDNYYKFRKKYFYTEPYKEHTWIPFPGTEEKIQDKIKPMVLRLDANDHLDLPEIVYNDIYVDLPPHTQKVYDEVEKHLFTELDDEGLVIGSEVSKYNCCRQIASGGLYKPLDFMDVKPPKNRKIFEIHNAKTEVLKNIMDELHGKPVLTAYHYKFTVPHVKAFLKAPQTPYIGAGLKGSEIPKIVKKWNEGAIPLLLGHPASMGHGLNMQYGPGNTVVWFSIPDNFENYDQLNRRIYRQGVKNRVIIHHLVARGTIEEMIIKRLRDKESRQKSLLDSLKEYRKGKLK